MKIAVTGPSGNIGSALSEYLLEAGVRVVLLARHPEKVHSCVEQGAELHEGSLDDERFVAGALRGVAAVFWLTPPNVESGDLNAFQRRLATVAAAAVRANRIRRVVNLSSIGANLGSGTGPVNGLHEVEKMLDGAAPNIAHLRPAFFFENFLPQIDSLVQSGRILMPVAGSARIPMIATRDVAQAAADLLIDPDWSGRIVRGLHGPADLSFDEVAEVFSKVLGRTVTHVRIEEGQMREMLVGSGLSEHDADLMLEMYRWIDAGIPGVAEPRTPQTTTPTTLTQFTEEVIAPIALGRVAT